jgi:transposase
MVEYDPPKSTGRSRGDQRAALDAIIFRLPIDCQWNCVPSKFPDDSSVHRTFYRCIELGVLGLTWNRLGPGRPALLEQHPERPQLVCRHTRPRSRLVTHQSMRLEWPCRGPLRVDRYRLRSPGPLVGVRHPVEGGPRR